MLASPWAAWETAAIALDAAVALRSGRAGVRQRQQRRLADLLAYAAAHSPLHRERLAVARFEDIEPIGKPALMARFDDWVTDPALQLPALRRFAADPASIGRPCAGEHWLWTSSGSSGEPGVFVQDAHALAVHYALESTRRVLADLAPVWPPPRMAFVGATGGHFASTVSLERVRRTVPGMAAALRGISFLQPMAAICAELEAFAPAVLTSYPTMALALAAEARAGRLRIAPRRVWTGGETLSPAMRREIGDAFGCRVADSYGASECLSIASECRCGVLHVNADWVLLEPVDEAHRPVPPGRFGHTTLLTNLANRVQPLIRYDLGDRVALHDTPCDCGSPLPWVEVEGRIDDLLVVDAGHGRRVALPPLAIVAVLEEEAGVFAFRVEQRDARTLRLQLDAALGRAALRRARQALAGYLAAQAPAGVRLEAALVEGLQREASGKRRRILGRAVPQTVHA